MSRLGNEDPHNNNPADMSSHADEAQLRLVQKEPEPEAPEPEVPPGLKLTEDQETRVQKLMETNGLDRGTAVLRTVSSSAARRIIGHHRATSQVAKHEADIRERNAQKVEAGPTKGELIELLRDPGPKNTDPSSGPTDQAA